MICYICKISKRTLGIWFIVFLSNSTSLFSQPQRITTPLNEGVTSERDFSYYNRLYPEFNLNQSVDSNLTQLSHFAIGPCMDVVVKGNLAYAGNGGYFQVVDISNPSQLVIMGEVLLPEGIVYDIEINGSYAYLLAPFTVIDITDPYNPHIIHSEIIGNAAQVLAVEGNYAYLGDFSAIRIIDISDPYNPVKLGVEIVSGEMVHSIAIKDSYLYATTYDGLVIDIIDVSNKNNPNWVNGFYIWSPGGGLFVKDTLLYAGTGLSPRFRIFNIANPIEIEYIDGIDCPYLPTDISVKDSIASVSIYKGGFSLINVKDNNPQVLLNISSTNSSTYLNHSIENDILLISFYSGFDIFEIENNDSLQYSGSYYTGQLFSRLDIKNNLLYGASGYGGLKIIDFSNPENLKVIGQYQNRSVFRDVEVGDSIAYILTYNSLILLNIQDNTNPSFISEFHFNNELTFSNTILLIDSIILAPIQENYLGIIDVSNPNLPTLIDSFEISDRVVDLDNNNSFLFCAEPINGIRIYNLNNHPPQFINSLNNGAGFSLTINNNILYCFMDGLYIYDIEDPESPVFISNFTIHGFSISYADISKNGNYLCIVLGRNLEIINVSDPAKPFLEGYSRDDRAISVASKGNLIFKGNGERGIVVYKADFITSIENGVPSLPSEFKLFQNYPNPFNPSTQIKYSVANDGLVTMKVYDVLGREVIVLVNEEKQAGTYTKSFNASHLSSGIYFYQIKAGNFVDTKKMILLR